MARYRIWNRQGTDFGTFDATSEVDALLQLYRSAECGPADVWIDADGNLAFRNDDVREFCGDVGDWDVEEID